MSTTPKLGDVSKNFKLIHQTSNVLLPVLIFIEFTRLAAKNVILSNIITKKKIWKNDAVFFKFSIGTVFDSWQNFVTYSWQCRFRGINYDS